MREDKRDSFFRGHMDDLADRAFYSGYPVFSDFLTEREVSLLRESHWQGISLVLWGGYDDCDRVVAGFFPTDTFPVTTKDTKEENIIYQLFPIVALKIKTLGHEEKKPGHRDYLGAVLGLGFERNKIGDIRIGKQFAYLFCHSEFADYIIEQLICVGRTSVECTRADENSRIPEREFAVQHQSVASPRLDNLVSVVSGLSRTKAAELVKQGLVLVDSVEKKSVSFMCSDKVVLTVRGYGKFRVEIPDDMFTKKGKQKITIYKYI